MNLRKKSFRRPALKLSIVAVALLLACPSFALGQTPEPHREQLLNGLRLLIVTRPGDAKVWMKLRIHTGAAFDLANREGTTALLADALFPDPSTPQYVREELGGQLDVRTTYDLIDITLSGNANEFDRLVELLRNAFLQMRLAPEDVQRLKAARLKTATDANALPAQIAERAARARLFGAHPYARTVEGTPESLARVERTDLMFARDRFLSPNNATLVVVGGVDEARAMRTFRQLLGAWHKSDSIPPATFRQPDAPDPRALIIAASGAREAEVRIAARGVSRSDKDRAAATLLAFVAKERWLAALKPFKASNASVVNESHALSGVFELGATVEPSSASPVIESARALLRSLAASPPSALELERAKHYLLAGDMRPTNPYSFADDWLDSITYNYDAASDARALDAVTPADIQRVAARLFGDAKLAIVVAGDESQLRASLANLPGGIEIAGAQSATQPAAPKPKP
jgi:zinc protease